MENQNTVTSDVQWPVSKPRNRVPQILLGFMAVLFVLGVAGAAYYVSNQLSQRQAVGPTGSQAAGGCFKQGCKKGETCNSKGVCVKIATPTQYQCTSTNCPGPAFYCSSSTNCANSPGYEGGVPKPTSVGTSNKACASENQGECGTAAGCSIGEMCTTRGCAASTSCSVGTTATACAFQNIGKCGSIAGCGQGEACTTRGCLPDIDCGGATTTSTATSCASQNIGKCGSIAGCGQGEACTTRGCLPDIDCGGATTTNQACASENQGKCGVAGGCASGQMCTTRGCLASDQCGGKQCCTTQQCAVYSAACAAGSSTNCAALGACNCQASCGGGGVGPTTAPGGGAQTPGGGGTTSTTTPAPTATPTPIPPVEIAGACMEIQLYSKNADGTFSTTPMTAQQRQNIKIGDAIRMAIRTNRANLQARFRVFFNNVVMSLPGPVVYSDAPNQRPRLGFLDPSTRLISYYDFTATRAGEYKFEGYVSTSPQAITCGGIAGVICPTGYTCNAPRNVPDATGTCVPVAR